MAVVVVVVVVARARALARVNRNFLIKFQTADIIYANQLLLLLGLFIALFFVGQYVAYVRTYANTPGFGPGRLADPKRLSQSPHK